MLGVPGLRRVAVLEGGGEPDPREAQWTLGVGTVRADGISPEVGQMFDSLGGRRIRAPRRRSPLHLLLEPTRRVGDAHDLRLADGDRGGEGFPIQPQPPRRIRRSVENLVRDVPAQPDVEGAAGHLSFEILAQLDGTTIIQDEPGFDLPFVGRVPGTVLRGEGRVCSGRTSATASQPGERQPQGRVPARLSRFVGTGHHRHARGQFEPFTVKGAEGARNHVRDAHVRRPPGRGVPRARAGQSAARDAEGRDPRFRMRSGQTDRGRWSLVRSPPGRSQS